MRPVTSLASGSSTVLSARRLANWSHRERSRLPTRAPLRETVDPGGE
jgi:hypothetical protein